MPGRSYRIKNLVRATCAAHAPHRRGWARGGPDRWLGRSPPLAGAAVGSLTRHGAGDGEGRPIQVADGEGIAHPRCSSRQSPP